MSRVDTIYDELSYAVIGAAMLGPGFPEKVYHEALMIALAEKGVPAEKEVPYTVQFRAQPVGEFHLDVLVDWAVVVALKALDELDSQRQQVISHLPATGQEVGLLLNFDTERLQRKRIFPPQRVQNSQPHQLGRDAWDTPYWQIYCTRRQ